MLSANINLAMLCLAQASAQAGCNCSSPKRHYLTLAVQLFSRNSATYFHQQVHFCSERMHTESLSIETYTTAELSWSYSCLLWRGQFFPPSSHAVQWHPLPLPSWQHWHGSCLPSRPNQQKTMLQFLFSVCQPGEATGSTEPGKRKTVSFQWQLDEHSCAFKTHPVLGGAERSLPSWSSWGREKEQEHQLILAHSPYHQQNTMLAPAYLTLGSLEAAGPCCSANSIFVAGLGCGQSIFLLWSAQRLHKRISSVLGSNYSTLNKHLLDSNRWLFPLQKDSYQGRTTGLDAPGAAEIDTCVQGLTTNFLKKTFAPSLSFKTLLTQTIWKATP